MSLLDRIRALLGWTDRDRPRPRSDGERRRGPTTDEGADLELGDRTADPAPDEPRLGAVVEAYLDGEPPAGWPTDGEVGVVIAVAGADPDRRDAAAVKRAVAESGGTVDYWEPDTVVGRVPVDRLPDLVATDGIAAVNATRGSPAAE